MVYLFGKSIILILMKISSIVALSCYSGYKDTCTLEKVSIYSDTNCQNLASERNYGSTTDRAKFSGC